MKSMKDNNENHPNFYLLFQKVGEIEGKLNTIERNLNQVVKNHEDRINNVEKDTSEMIGKSKVVGGIWGFLSGAIISMISHFLKQQ